MATLHGCSLHVMRCALFVAGCTLQLASWCVAECSVVWVGCRAVQHHEQEHDASERQGRVRSACLPFAARTRRHAEAACSSCPHQQIISAHERIIEYAVREEKATCTVAPDYEATGRAAASARTSARRPRPSWPTRSIKSDLARNWPLACAAAPGLSLPKWPQSSCLPRAHGAAFKLGPVASAPGSEFTAGAARPELIHRSSTGYVGSPPAATWRVAPACCIQARVALDR